MYDFVMKIWKGVFRAHCTQIRSTCNPGLRRVHVSFTLSSAWWRKISKITFLRKVIRSVSQNIKMRNGLIAQKAKVLGCSNFALILDFLSVTVWAKKKNWKYCFDPKSHVGFCYQNLKKCVYGSLHPNLRYLKAGLPQVHVSFTLSSAWWRKISKNIFLRKVIRSFRKISKCETGSLHKKRKYYGAQILYWY